MKSKLAQPPLASRAAEALRQWEAERGIKLEELGEDKAARALKRHGSQPQPPLSPIRSSAPPTHRDAPRGGRRPRPRSGVERLVFADAAGPVVFHVRPGAEPSDWADALTEQLLSGKLALLSRVEQLKDASEATQRGIMDPRAPALVRQGRSVEYRGRAEAHPGSITDRVRALGHGVPEWVTSELVAWLVELVSAEGGGRGQLSAKRVSALLRRPDLLGRELWTRVVSSRELRRIAASVPRKRPRPRRV